MKRKEGKRGGGEGDEEGGEGERILPIHHKMATFFSALVKATSHSASNLKRLYSKRYKVLPYTVLHIQGIYGAPIYKGYVHSICKGYGTPYARDIWCSICKGYMVLHIQGIWYSICKGYGTPYTRDMHACLLAFTL